MRAKIRLQRDAVLALLKLLGGREVSTASLRKALWSVVSLLDAQAASIVLCAPAGRVGRRICAVDPAARSAEVRRALERAAGDALRTARLLRERRAGDRGRCFQVLGMPLRDSRSVCGAITLLRRGAQPFSSTEERLLGACATALARASSVAGDCNGSLPDFSRVLAQAADSVVITDAEGVIRYVNEAFERTTGYGRAEAVGRGLDILRSDSTPDAVYAEMREALRDGRPFRDVFIHRRKDGSLVHEEQTFSPLRDERGRITHHVAVGKDVSERIAREERLRRMAHHDPLTGLPNRMLLLDRLARALARARWNKRTVAVLSLDLDRFRVVNDTLGHDAGDRLLLAVAARLTGCVRDGDTVARLGGDELAIVLEDMAQPDHISPVARKILDVFAQPFVIEGRELYVTTSIGISLFPTDGDEAQALAKQADIALNRAKESGGNCFQFYSRHMGAMASERLMLETDLRRALERQEFILYYQPQVDLRTGQVVGAEALLRWPHPEFGMIPPPRFIGLAEETGLIVPLGEWVLHAACEQARRWHADGLPVRLAVNLSARQVVHGRLTDTVAAVLADTRLPPEFLELELTESTLLDQTRPALDALNELQALGTRFSIDDFGTGYSSLSYLKRFPIDALKIDRSFVRDVTHDPDDAAIVTAITQMAHGLGLLVVAEGVETRAQLDFLRARNCDAFQGFYLSRPVPADRFASLMRVFGIPARA